MKSWRGVPVLMSVLSGLVVACGPVPEGEEVAGGEVREAEVAPRVEATGGMPTVSGLGGLVTGLLSYVWEVCDDVARRVKDINPGAPGSAPEHLVHGDGLLFFSADDGVNGHGRELWASTGEGSRTFLVKDINPGKPSSTPTQLTALGPWVLFVATEPGNGPELWRTDGTEQGTVLVKDIHRGQTGSLPNQLTRVGDFIYFTANDGEHGRELWRTDGTAQGTVLVRDFVPGGNSAGPDKLTAWGDTLALVASADGAVAALWAVDRKGRASVLHALGYGVFLRVTAADKQLFFTVDVGTDEADLWVTRNRPGTAEFLRHFPGQEPTAITALGDAVYFVAGGEGILGQVGDPLHGAELWTSDGTVRGTRLVRDINPGPEGAFSIYDSPWMEAVGDLLYFAATDGAGLQGHGLEPWRSNGTSRGTWLLRDVEPGPAGSNPTLLAGANGWLFFSADTTGHGREVWYSNGAPWHTRPLLDIAPGAASSNPRNFVLSGWDVFFLATEGGGGEELWAVPFRPRRECADGDC
ncbi:ELWxxDGT repeat protein [Pyxidicoccus sp. 3LG]